jgi:seryl-tRNA synthetase
MLLISIIALVIIAGAVFYMYKSSSSIDVVLENKDLTDDIEKVTASVSESIKQVEKMAAKIDEALASVPATPSKKVKAEIAKEEVPVVEVLPVVEVAPVVEAAPVAPVVDATPAVEAPKPAKKKRRYYPKKK